MAKYKVYRMMDVLNSCKTKEQFYHAVIWVNNLVKDKLEYRGYLPYIMGHIDANKVRLGIPPRGTAI